jgi:hypothetical protein
MTANHYPRSCCLPVLALALLAGLPGPGRGDEPLSSSGPSLFPRDFGLGSVGAAPSDPTVPRANRIRLFRIVPGFLTEPVGLDLDDPSPSAAQPAADDGPSWLQVAFNGDNPFLDLRRRGDPGGVGYYRLSSQVQLFDSPTTCCALGFRAVTPAGREVNGAADGPTFVSPALSFFQALDGDFAVQAFVGKNMRLDVRSQPPLNRAVEYGMAVNRPLTDGVGGQGRVYMFVEALGRYRYDSTSDSSQPVWEMVPGVHWQMTDNWWLSGGYVLPITAPRTETGQWQISCWLQF